MNQSQQKSTAIPSGFLYNSVILNYQHVNFEINEGHLSAQLFSRNFILEEILIFLVI